MSSIHAYGKMPTALLIRLCAGAAIVGGLLVGIAGILIWMGNADDGLFLPLFVVPWLLLLAGLTGVQLRQADRSAWLGWIGLAVALIGTCLGIATSMGWFRLAWENIFRGFFLVLPAGWLLSSVATLRADVLPRLSVVPLILAALVSIIIYITVYIVATVDETLVQNVDFNLLWMLILLLFGMGWMWLGAMLWLDGRRAAGHRTPAMQ